MYAQLLPKPQATIVTVKNFYVDGLVDDRLHKYESNPVAASPNKSSISQNIEFPGGFTAIQNFIKKHIVDAKTQRPVIIQLKDCYTQEFLPVNGRVDGLVHLQLVFKLKQNPIDDPVHLTDYQIDVKYLRSVNRTEVAAATMQQTLITALVYLDNWIANQADHNPKLAKIVKVYFNNHLEKVEGDTIYYAQNRPLTWNDFQDKPQAGKFAAMVFPSFGFEEKQEVANGEIRLYLDLKIYLPKSASWVKAGYQNSYSLNHEQRHFDLVAIVGKHFEQKIKAAKLLVNNLDGLINVEYYESFREMNRLQKQYDNETEHGTNSSKQEEWNTYINNELIKLGIVKPAL